MQINEIEDLPDVQASARVLSELESRGIKEAAIAAGWTRTLIAGGNTSDIDVSYVGDVHYGDAQVILAHVLDEVNPPNREMWDVKGIWNAEIAYGVSHTVDNFLLYYLNSIDSVYLASDGKLHDPTGYGFQDAKTQTLRINDYDLDERTTTASEEVNVCLENCRRLAKFGWTPTSRTIERVTGSVPRWLELADDEKSYFVNKLKTKYSDQERLGAKAIYGVYGWGFIFDL
jgi:hypothetical protein